MAIVATDRQSGNQIPTGFTHPPLYSAKYTHPTLYSAAQYSHPVLYTAQHYVLVILSSFPFQYCGQFTNPLYSLQMVALLYFVKCQWPAQYMPAWPVFLMHFFGFSSHILLQPCNIFNAPKMCRKRVVGGLVHRGS